jgi:thiamine pyrophosphokinase
LSELRALVVADGELDELALRAALRAGPALVVAADGGARHLAALGRLPDLICGDGDSLGDEIESFRERGVALELHPADKDESDLELALAAVIQRGVLRIDVLGALAGARPEHGVANELMLAAPQLDGSEVVLHHRGSRLRRIGTLGGPGSAELQGAPSDFVSLLAMDDSVSGVVTHGLRFPLRNEPLALGSTRGLSNELTGSNASVITATGRLLIVESPRNPPASGAQP